MPPQGGIAVYGGGVFHRRVACVCCVVCACLFFPSLGAMAGFGSESLLRSLWTQGELAGNPADHVVTRPYANPADLSPPARTGPLIQLDPTSEGLRGVIRRVRIANDAKVLALTFDLCERASNRTGYRTEIVNCLREKGVAATFSPVASGCARTRSRPCSSWPIRSSNWAITPGPTPTWL